MVVISRQATRLKSTLSILIGLFLFCSGLASAQTTLPAPVKIVGCEGTPKKELGDAFTDMAKAADLVQRTVETWTCADWEKSSAAKAFFGSECSRDSLDQVKSVIMKSWEIADGHTEITLDCSGTGNCGNPVANCQNPKFKGVYAFHCPWPSNPKIVVCPDRFFKLPVANKAKSQETILYHEITHWAGTTDGDRDCNAPIACPQCGGGNCKSCETLATRDPSGAQNVANSYMFFASAIDSGSDPCGAGGIALALAVGGVALMRRRRALIRSISKGQIH